MLRNATSPGGSEETSEVAGEPTSLRQGWIACAGDESIAVLIPLAPRVVITQDCGIGLGLVTKTERQVAFDQTLQSLGDMRCGLIIVNNSFEPVHRGQVLTTCEVVTTDLHFLTGQMVASKIEFKLGIPCILAVGKTTYHIVERL